MERINTYEKFLEREGIPVIRGYHVPDVMDVPLQPWTRKGGLGAYLNLIGSEGVIDAYLCEIPAGKSLVPQKHVYEEMIYILDGSGATSIWVDGSPKESFEWQEGSLFSPPLNAWHQHFNGQSNKPVRYLGVTRAPVFMNLFHDLDFIFNDTFLFTKRYSGTAGYFSSQGRSYEDTLWGDPRVWESNFVPDVRIVRLEDEPEGGMGAIASVQFEMANNLMSSHVHRQPPGTYKKAHFHGPGAQLLCLGGQGYEMMWPAEGGIMAQGVERVKFPLQKGSIFSPPDRWYHQHFITGKEPTTMLAFHSERSHRYVGLRKTSPGGGRLSVKSGGTQINYEDEDPEIRRVFKEELAKSGGTWGMSKFFPGE